MPERHRTEFQIKHILKSNRDGSPDKQSARHQNLMRCVKELRARGYSNRWDVHKLGKKEVSRLVHDWKEKGIADRTIANRLADIRWLATKINRAEFIPSNKDAGLGLRQNQPGFGENKAQQLEQRHLDQMDPRMQLVNELKVEFGLREKEALMIQHGYATAASETYIQLQGRWCKGGRPRVIEVVSDRQRDLLSRVGAHQKVHGDRSMIPSQQTYKTYKKIVQAKSTELGVRGHGLRHQWAQDRFTQVSQGIQPPLAGGPAYSSLNERDQALWDKAARRVNEELGHGKGREDITATYIGARG